MERSASTPSKKLDHRRGLKELYGPRVGPPAIVDVPELSFLMVDGMGDPNTSRNYREAVEALFAVLLPSEARGEARRRWDGSRRDALGMWWVDDMSTFSLEDKSNWSWTAMIMQPDVVTDELIQRSIPEASKKKPLPAATEPRLDRFGEGSAAQVLHMGP